MKNKDGDQNEGRSMPEYGEILHGMRFMALNLVQFVLI